MLSHSLILIASFLLAVMITPMVRAFSIRHGIVDKPDTHRKLHGRVIARAGGTAVLLSVLAVCAMALLSFDIPNLGSDRTRTFVSLLVGLIGIWGLGLYDDIWTLRGRQKLIGQIIVSGILISGGFQIRHISLFGIGMDLGFVAIPVSLLWLLATTNALNLIDGADGLCSTLGAIICGALGVLAYVNNHFAEAALAFSMCGALLGFLVFNFPPASIFLGDSGSLLIGMTAGALSIRCALKGPAGLAFLAPLAILSIPLLDSAMAIVRRKLTGRSIYATDRAHLHHKLRNKGLGERGLLLAVTIMASITAFGALLGQALGRDWIAPIGVLVVVGILVATKAFGYTELVLVLRRGSHMAMSFIEPMASRGSAVTALHRVVRLQGTRDWDTIWATLVEFCEREGVTKLHMDLNVPWLEEGVNGVWQQKKQPHRDERWSSSLPIHAGDRVVGRIDIVGPVSNRQSISSVVRLVELLEDLGPQLEHLTSNDLSVAKLPTPVLLESQTTDKMVASQDLVSSSG